MDTGINVCVYTDISIYVCMKHTQLDSIGLNTFVDNSPMLFHLPKNIIYS